MPATSSTRWRWLPPGLRVPLRPQRRSYAVPWRVLLPAIQGQSQSFSHGEQASYGGALAAYVVAAGGQTTQSKTSTVTAASNVKMRWSKNTTSTKYVCGYGDSPGPSTAAPPIAAIGRKHRWT